MKVPLVSIGNSKGVGLPASITKQCGFSDMLEMRIENEGIILTAVAEVRQGWDAAFASMAEAGDDAPVWPEEETLADFEDWTW